MTLFSAPEVPITDFHGLLSGSSTMRDFFGLVQRVARTDSAVLIRGESGTGKELVARAIHELSQRQAQPFCAVNCATLTPELTGSELFGHAKGAFTGAANEHRGYFEAANKGTLFLDEVAELSLNVQSRLLRALQEKTITRVGSTRARQVDIRILSATNRGLRVAVERKQFREDLMYRLRVVPLFLPRLVDRGRDIEILAWRFIEEFNAKKGRNITHIDGTCRDALLSYAWPGNVRELRNNIEHAFAVGEGPIMSLPDLPPELRGEARVDGSEPGSFRPDYAHSERLEYLRALEETSGHKGKAAELLGISRATFWRKSKQMGLL